MKTISFLILILAFGIARGQQAEPLLFDETIHDFGNIREDWGNADYEFNFTNNSGRTLTILSVQASCGCTTPGWTKEPVPHGKGGFIRASYDPRGRPGYFNKTLTISTDLDRNPIVLQIKGQVTNDENDNDNSRLTAASGSLRLKSSAINFGKVYINKAPAIQEVVVYNSGEKAVTIHSVLSPDHIKTDVPDVIQPRTRGVLKLTYNTALRNMYGFVSDNIELITDDGDLPRKSFSVYATIEEFFSKLSFEEMDKAPVMLLDATTLDFGRIRTGASIQREVTIRNTGKKELIIRTVQPNCACISTAMESVRIKPGGEQKMMVTLKGEGRKGTQNKAITLYATDPKNPVQRIAITAIVE